ncbi:MAG: hypothetical protein QF849_13165 [Pseudomonadales bacterium]|nr:hypothetical protein [Pseudomonadales bacterium]
MGALQILEQEPAHLVVIEAEADDMTCSEIAEAIRDIDNESARFTYNIIVEGESSVELSQELSQALTQSGCVN